MSSAPLPTDDKIGLFTGTRAEYGLLKWLYRALVSDGRFEAGWIVTGTHLDPVFGGTLGEIEADGGTVWMTAKQENLGSSRADMCAGLGWVTAELGHQLGELELSALVVLGDRYEALAAALASYTLGVPVIHVHGGEITEGALDDGYRHAITKLASLHFPAAEPYRKRIVQMGELPVRVFSTGALVNDAIAAIAPVSREELERQIGCELGSLLFIVTVHPETVGKAETIRMARRLAAALAEIEGGCVVWTYANADSGGRDINEFVDSLPAQYGPGFIVRASLGHELYINAMRHCDVVIGNSSSGIIEAPLIPVASVNIGSRQDARLRTPSVVDCEADGAEITDAIRTALSAKHRALSRNGVSPYKGQDVAAKMARVIGNDMGKLEGAKTFYDLDGYALG